jgi:hypothetical protein
MDVKYVIELKTESKKSVKKQLSKLDRRHFFLESAGVSYFF